MNAICYGAKLMIPGLLRYASGIEVDDEVRRGPCQGCWQAVGAGVGWGEGPHRAWVMQQGWMGGGLQEGTSVVCGIIVCDSRLL